MYKEPVKNKTRELLLSSAVRDLTTERQSSFIIKTDEIEGIYRFIIETLVKYDFYDSDALSNEAYYANLYEFIEEYNDSNASRKPSTLKVLFLCGPEPSNDIKVLKKLGIKEKNIWAIESNSGNYREAINDILKYNYNINIYNDKLSDFLKLNTVKFDIVYFDSCSVFSTSKKESIDSIVQILHSNCISSLSVLITNFSEIKDNEIYLSAEMASFYSSRYNDYPDFIKDTNLDPEHLAYEDSYLKKVIESDIHEFYSDYITRLILDLGRFLIPNTRAMSHKIILNEVLKKEEVKTTKNKAYKDPIKQLKKTPKNMEELFEQLEDWDINQKCYPVYSFINKLPQMTGESSFTDYLKSLSFNSRKLGDLIPLSSKLNAIVEDHWSLINENYLVDFLGIWFDGKGGLFCDVPLPNLLINSHLGKLGHPIFPNTSKMKRYTYKAKETTMYTDYFVLDDCIDYFEWFPSLGSTVEFFKDNRNQYLARAILDRIGRTDLRSESNPFIFSSIVCFGESDLAFDGTIPERSNITV
ncbi:hypothetical protein QUF50_07675 [Thiotrichales bacterium HSG1]|nr:hypothetical protein [Thiotrichales bacterium HSG1]